MALQGPHQTAWKSTTTLWWVLITSSYCCLLRAGRREKCQPGLSGEGAAPSGARYLVTSWTTILAAVEWKGLVGTLIEVLIAVVRRRDVDRRDRKA